MLLQGGVAYTFTYRQLQQQRICRERKPDGRKEENVFIYFLFRVLIKV